jgi:hypothetical protein
VISLTQRPVPDNTQQSKQTNFHATSGNRNRDPRNWADADLHRRSHGHFNRHKRYLWDRIMTLYFILRALYEALYPIYLYGRPVVALRLACGISETFHSILFLWISCCNSATVSCGMWETILQWHPTKLLLFQISSESSQTCGETWPLLFWALSCTLCNTSKKSIQHKHFTNCGTPISQRLPKRAARIPTDTQPFPRG